MGRGEEICPLPGIETPFQITHQALLNHFLAPTITLQVPSVCFKHILISTLHQPDLSTKGKAVFHVEAFGNQASMYSTPSGMLAWKDVPFT